MTANPSANLSKILLDPSASYDLPQDVVDDKNLTQDQKIEILRRWEYDEAEKQVAEEEGMIGNKGDTLNQILLLLNDLTDGYDAGRTPPTKQGGLDRTSVKPKPKNKDDNKP